MSHATACPLCRRGLPPQWSSEKARALRDEGVRMAKRHEIGAQMANVIFNCTQNVDNWERARELLKDLQKQWDAIK